MTFVSVLLACCEVSHQSRLTLAGPLTDEWNKELVKLYKNDTITKQFKREAEQLFFINGDYLGYRLGDIISKPGTDLNDIGQSWTKKFSDHASSVSQPKITLGAFTTALWPESIGADLIRLRWGVSTPSNLLNYVLNKRCPKPVKNATVIHLRIGDQLENCMSNFEQCNEGRMMRPSTLAAIAKSMKLLYFNITNQPVIFVAGIHRAGDFTATHLRALHAASMRYVAVVKRLFEQEGYNCVVQSKTPDCDFCTMYMANILVPTLSSFSRSAADVTTGRVVKLIVKGPNKTAEFLEKSHTPSSDDATVRLNPLSC